MGRSKHKNGQQTQNQHLINPGSSESEDDLDEVLIVSRYGEKDEKNNVWFRFSDLVTEEKHNPNQNCVQPIMYPVGFPGTHYSIAVKELVIEWEDYQAGTTEPRTNVLFGANSEQQFFSNNEERTG